MNHHQPMLATSEDEGPFEMGEIRVHLNNKHDAVVSMGMTKEAAASLIFLMCAAEYAMKVSADNSPMPLQCIDALFETVRSMRKALNGGPPQFKIPDDPDGPYISFRVFVFGGGKSSRIEIGSNPPVTDKAVADRMIDVAAPTLLYLLAGQSGAGFDEALKVTYEGVVDGYKTVYSKS